MSKISHEIPISLFPQHDFINDYAYVLAHLLLPKHYNKEYAAFYKQKIQELEYSILDNSCFELGNSIDYKELYKLGEEYKPSHIILPDSLHDSKVTKGNIELYLKEFSKCSTPKFIGVLQGKSFEEIEELLQFYLDTEEIDIIAIPFDIMKPAIPENIININQDKIWRYEVLTKCIFPYMDRISYRKKVSFRNKIHLLGCATPLEFKMYSVRDLRYINSIDTSAPIIYGWNNIDISDLNLDSSKPKDKLAENLEIQLSNKQILNIAKNLHSFRKFIL